MGEIYDRLVDIGAIHLNGHFRYTSGVHVDRYHNVRQAVSDNRFMSTVSTDLAHQSHLRAVDGIIGPETLGRTLAERAAQTAWYNRFARDDLKVLWCQLVKRDDGSREVVLPDEEKFAFERLITQGSRWRIIDDVLSKGTTVQCVIEFLRAHGAEVEGVSVVLRLNQSITDEVLDVPDLLCLDDVEDVEMLEHADCLERGMCSRHEPMVRRPGHGWEHELEFPDYPGGYIDLDR